MGIIRGKIWTRGGRGCNEPGLYEQVQRAVNWVPGFPPHDAEWNENNEWTDPDTGKVWKKMTLKEVTEGVEMTHPNEKDDEAAARSALKEVGER